MTRPWRLLLGAAIVLAIAVWDVGLPGKHSTPTGTAAASSPSAVSSPSAAASLSAAAPAPVVPNPAPPNVPGVLHPTGNPAFTAAFSRSSLDTSVWDTCYPQMSQSGCTNFGNVPIEAEWYLPSQVQVSGGELHLIAQRETTAGQSSTGSPQDYACRSGMVTSYPGFQFQYGYLQIVAQIPTGSGLWPAIWLAATNFRWPPEMDIVEAYGGPPFGAYTYFHYRTSAGNKFTEAQIPTSSATGWHTFALSWTSTQLTWLVDGQVIQTVTQDVPQQKMYVIADLAEQVLSPNTTVTPGQCNGSLDIRSVTWWPA